MTKWLRGLEEYQAHFHSDGTLEIFIEPVLPRPSPMVLGVSPVAEALACLTHDVNYTVAAACKTEDALLDTVTDQLVEGWKR